MKNKEIVELADKDLTQELKDKRVFFFFFFLNHKVSDIENPMIIRSTRRTIARIKTELTNRKTSTAK